MQTRNRLLDDAARIAGGAVGTLAGAKREIEALVRQQIERVLSSLDLVTREEFDTVREMARKARAEQDAMAERLAAVEKHLGTVENRPVQRRKTPRKPKKTVQNNR